MKTGFAFKAWVYLLCLSFLSLATGFHDMIAEAKEMGRPLGEMVSKGEVKFESRNAVWKNVELSQFPIFPGMRIKTEKGASLITLQNNSQIDVGENSLLAFDQDQNDQLHIAQGAIDFRLPPAANLSFNVGNFTVIKSTPFQASKNPSALSPKSETTFGSVSVHPNGAITVKSLQGSLSVLNKDRVVLAALSSKDTVTIPAAAAKSPSKVMVAQAGEKTSDQDPESGKFLGIGTWGWVGIIGGVAVVAAIVVIAASSGGGDSDHGSSCP